MKCTCGSCPLCKARETERLHRRLHGRRKRVAQPQTPPMLDELDLRCLPALEVMRQAPTYRPEVTALWEVCV